MPVRQTYNFDTGPNGAAIGVAGDIVAVTGATYSNDFMHGSFALGLADSTQFIRINNSGTVNQSGSVYVKINTNPGTSAARIVTFTSSTNATLMVLRLNGNGHFDIASSTNTQQVQSTSSWSVGNWYRLDWQWDGTTQAAPILTARIFLSPEGTSPSETITYTGSGLASACTRWTIAMLSSSTYVGVIDTFRNQDGLVWIGAFNPSNPPGTVTHTWVGAPTATGFRVTSLTGAATSVRLKVCTDAGMTTGTVFVAAQTPDATGYVSHTVTGLANLTQYYYQLEDTPSGGSATLIGNVGKAKTLPPTGSAQSFTFAFGGCCTTNATNGSAFDDIRTWNPNFFIHMGDFHYKDPTSTDPTVHAQDWADQIQGVGTGELKTFVRDMPMFYIRSDHDAGPSDNGDSNNASTAAGIVAYQEVVPSLPLADVRSPVVGLYFSWVVGRVRFICVDIRNTDRSPGLDAQSSSKTMLGATQKTWLKARLLDPEPLKIIVSDVAWPGPASTANGEDKWWSYDDERTEIGTFITANSVKVLMLTSDSHSLLADDGSHNTWGGFPIYGAAPLSNVGGGRNLTYYTQIFNTGNLVTGHQYGRVTVTDNGTSISTQFQGYDVVGAAVVVDQTDTFAAPATNAGKGKYWDSGSSTWKPFTPKPIVAGVPKVAVAKVWNGSSWIITKP